MLVACQSGLAGARLEHRNPSGAGRESLVEDGRLVGLTGTGELENGRGPTGSETDEAEFQGQKRARVLGQPGQAGRQAGLEIDDVIVLCNVWKCNPKMCNCRLKVKARILVNLTGTYYAHFGFFVFDLPDLIPPQEQLHMMTCTEKRSVFLNPQPASSVQHIPPHPLTVIRRCQALRANCRNLNAYR